VDFFLLQLVNGLSLGAIYGLIAVGYSMVYGTIGLVNFAHGDIVMLGGFISLIGFLLLAPLGISIVPLALGSVLLVTIALTGLFGWLVERLAYRPLRGAPRLASLISAIGVSIILQNSVLLSQGASVKRLQPLVSGAFAVTVPGPVHLTIGIVQILIVVTAAVVMAAFAYVIRTTALGRAHRAMLQDRTMAALLGVNVDRMTTASFVIGSGFAAVAGLMVTLYYGAIDFSAGFVIGIQGLIAAVLGGLGSPAGAMFGGILIGLADAFWSGYFGVAYRDAAVFGILILVLIFRPAGLLGRAEVERI